MQRRKKQLLGAVGLASVAAVTAVACALPAPEAGAVDSDSGNMTITVTVNKKPGSGTSGGGGSYVTPDVTITTPTDLSTWFWGRGGVPVVSNYTDATRLIYMLDCERDGRTIFEDEVVHTSSVSGSGTDTFTLTDEVVLATIEKAKANDKVSAGRITTANAETEDAKIVLAKAAVENPYVRLVDTQTKEYLEYNFILKVKTSDYREPDDAVRFSYRELLVTVNTDKKAENGDPLAQLQTSANVHKVVLQVYTKSGQPVFVNRNGVEEPLSVGRAELEKGKFTANVQLPMAKYGAKPGLYDLVAVAYDKDGNAVLSMNVNEFKYEPGVNIPNTGTIFGSLNISRVDYVLTGVIAFGAVAVFLAYLIVRKSREER